MALIALPRQAQPPQRQNIAKLHFRSLRICCIGIFSLLLPAFFVESRILLPPRRTSIIPVNLEQHLVTCTRNSECQHKPSQTTLISDRQPRIAAVRKRHRGGKCGKIRRTTADHMLKNDYSSGTAHPALISFLLDSDSIS